MNTCDCGGMHTETKHHRSWCSTLKSPIINTLTLTSLQPRFKVGDYVDCYTRQYKVMAVKPPRGNAILPIYAIVDILTGAYYDFEECDLKASN